MSSNVTKKTKVAICSTDRSDSINDTRTSDLKVTFNGTDYALHRMMVEAVSKYFSSALSDFKESVSKHIIIDLDFVSQDDFLFVIRWLYGAQVDVALDVKQLESIYRLVCYLQAEEIRNHLLDLIKKMVTTGKQILDHNITCRSLLNDISEHVSHQIEDSDVCRLLRLSRETHSELLIKVCHEKLEEGGCLSKNNISSFKEFTAEDVCVLFSAEEVESLSSEDELLSLMQEVCIEASLTDDEQKEVARNVMIQELSKGGISKAIRWDAIDNESLASCLAGEQFWSARRFGQKASIPRLTRPVVVPPVLKKPQVAPQPVIAGYGAPQPFTAGYGAPQPVPAGYGAPQPFTAGYGAPQPVPAGYGAPQPFTAGYGAPQPVTAGYGAPQPVPAGYGARRFTALEDSDSLFGSDE